MSCCGEVALQLDLDLAGLDLGEIENVVDQVEQVLAAGMDGVEIFAALFLALGEAAAQHVGEADDRVHRRADFVAHAGQEFALGAVGGFGDFTWICSIP